MKKYIRTKQVEAEPMTMGEAYERGYLRAGRVPNEAQKDNAGYHIVHDGGYESWSRAELFDKAYRVADTFLDRLNIERAELADKIEKLGAFLQGKVFKTLEGKQQHLLNEQYSTMCAYLTILDERIALIK